VIDGNLHRQGGLGGDSFWRLVNLDGRRVAGCCWPGALAACLTAWSANVSRETILADSTRWLNKSVGVLYRKLLRGSAMYD
jgi:hypothetical protein